MLALCPLHSRSNSIKSIGWDIFVIRDATVKITRFTSHVTSIAALSSFLFVNTNPWIVDVNRSTKYSNQWRGRKWTCNHASELMRWMRNNFLSCCFNVLCFHSESDRKKPRENNICSEMGRKLLQCQHPQDPKKSLRMDFRFCLVPEMQTVIIEIFRTNTTPHRNTSTILFLLVLTDLIRKCFFLFSKKRTQQRRLKVAAQRCQTVASLCSVWHFFSDVYKHQFTQQQSVMWNLASGA